MYRLFLMHFQPKIKKSTLSTFTCPTNNIKFSTYIYLYIIHTQILYIFFKFFKDREFIQDHKSNYQIVEYVWKGQEGNVHSKGGTIFCQNELTIDKMPCWDLSEMVAFDHSGDDPEPDSMFLKPQRLYKDPFRVGGYIVLCDTWKRGFTETHPTNTRLMCAQAMIRAGSFKPWFGIEFEYYMVDPKNNMPLGYPKNGGQHIRRYQNYCSVGTKNVFKRELVEDHYRACLFSGIMVILSIQRDFHRFCQNTIWQNQTTNLMNSQFTGIELT